MSDDLYRELILDHYKSPRNHGLLDPADASAEGQNPLCGDEITITLRFDGGDTIEDDRLRRPRVRDQPGGHVDADRARQGRTVAEVAAMPTEELLEEIGVPLQQNPARLKCALLGLGVLKVALHRAKGTPLPEEWAGIDELEIT